MTREDHCEQCQKGCYEVLLTPDDGVRLAFLARMNVF